jgi:hypothetical protein
MKIHPSELITPQRLDICSKIPLVRAWHYNYDERWGRDLYFAYLERIKPIGGFNQDEGKFTLDDYYAGFKALYLSMLENGFQESIGSIPLGNTGVINGAHRIAIALILNLDVDIHETGEKDHIYDFKFLNSIGLAEVYKDAILEEFLRIKKNIRVFCLMGLDQSTSNRVQKSLSENRKLIFTKTINLTEIGQRRLMKVLYGTNSWWRDELLETLSMERFTHNLNEATFVFTETYDIESDILLKSSLRSNFIPEIYNKRIHSTDSQQEVIILSQTLLNSNSLHFLNHSPIGGEERIVNMVKKAMEENGLNDEAFTIDGSSTLEMYSIRQANDVDYVIQQNNEESSRGVLGSHNLEYSTQLIKTSDLIYDPRCYFMWDQIKFVSIPALITFKVFRGEIKDLKDISLISQSLEDLPRYSSIESLRRARTFRLLLHLRSRVDGLLSHLPSPFSQFVREIYKLMRNLYRVFSPFSRSKS